MPYPLGATWDGHGVNFALFSANATKVELCLFDRSGRREIKRVALPERSEDIWHGYFSEVTPGQLYGYRVHGPYAPEAGHRFNHHKLLIDPYSRRLAGSFQWHDLHFGYRKGSKQEDLSFDRRDSARVMIKSVVVDGAGSAPARGPRIAWEDTVFYEAHVKGLTEQRTDVPAEMRGTFRALAAPGVIAHLRRLGVTTIELLPVHSHVDEQFLVERGLRNYWGYNTLSFFAFDARFAGGDPDDEFRDAVAALHDAGIEVILDVVYNHTCEGDHRGPTLCYRGIDNASYYWLKPDAPRFYENFTGCGNALNLTHPRVLQMVMDSLRLWVEAFAVDGFRFDLAPTLGRDPAFNRHAPFFAALRQDPVLGGVKLVAEPWDLGEGGYQLGGFPAGWSEWNDAYRTALRRFWRGEENMIGDLAHSMTASAEHFQKDSREPHASINHVTVHDGFTLSDWASYEHKFNEANGEDNRDGTNDNFSLNCGAEGATGDPAVLALRRRLRCNQFACLFLAQGVPLLLAGDEVGNSQDGNNNAYAQDNAIGWVDWSRAGSEDDLGVLIAALTRLRREFPQLRPRHWLDGKKADGSYDVKWLTPLAAEMAQTDWTLPHARFLCYVLAAPDETGKPLYVVLNGADTAVEIIFPAWAGVVRWRCVLDTSDGRESTLALPPGADWSAPSRCVAAFAGES